MAGRYSDKIYNAIGEHTFKQLNSLVKTFLEDWFV